MSEDVKLEPCPFCGVVPEEYEESYGHWRIYCANDDCPVQVDVTDPSKEEAVAAWNTRVGEQAAYERGKAAERAQVLEIIRYPKNAFPESYPDWMIGLIELDIINGVQPSGETK